MRGLLVIVLCCVSVLQVTQSHNRRSEHHHHEHLRSRRGPLTSLPPHSKPIHLHGVLGTLPNKYVPLSKIDEIATFIAGKMFPEALHSTFPDTYIVNQFGPIDVELPSSWVRAKLYLNNLVVRGIHQIVLQQLEVRTRNDRVDFVALAPAVSADMNFEVEGHIGYAPVYLTGTISLGEQDLNPSGAISVKKVTLPYLGERYQMDAGDVSVEIQNLKITIGDVDADTDLNYLKNQVVDDVKDKVADLIVRTAFKEVNKVLEKIPAAKIYNILTNKF